VEGTRETIGPTAAEADSRAEAFARLAEEACSSNDPVQVARACAALRDEVLHQCEQGSLSPAEARAICGVIEEAQLEALGRGSTTGGQSHELELRSALQTFESLIETSPLPILSTDRLGLVQIWNRAAEELFGWSREEVLRRPVPFVPDGGEDDAREILAGARAGLVIRNREVRRLRKDGAPIDLALSIAPLRDARGNVSGSIAILADITERKRREHQTEEATRFREHFVSIVGHDLRNPLTAIITSAQLLLRYGGLNARQSRVVGRVGASADRMARMIDDLLDFARTRLGGGFPIHPRRMDLGELTQQTVEELLFAYPGRSVRIDPQGDLWGNWDPDRIAQVISNLIGNALLHGLDGGEVLVTLLGEHDTVVFETQNGGIPVPPEVLPHVFEPGRRGDARAGGLGLGLFIVQQIVLAHGGSIEARSTEADGTTFTVVLPRKARGKV